MGPSIRRTTYASITPALWPVPHKVVKRLYFKTPDSPIEEIGFERGDIDSVRFLKSEAVFYWGDRVASEEQGCYEAELATGDTHITFQILARIADGIGLKDMHHHYSALVWHGDFRYVSIVQGGERKTVLNYGSGAPAELYLFQEFLLRTMEKLKWKKVGGSHSAAECLQLDIAKLDKGDAG